MTASLARRIAFDILRVVEESDAHASDLLHERLSAKVKPADAALATELTLGVLRWQGLLDFLVEKQTQRTAASLDAAARIALRMGLYELRYLTRVPARATVNEAVELVKGARKRSAAALVNAVLRRLAERAKAHLEAELPAGLSLVQRLAIEHSHPAWMVERWLARFGEAETVALLEANNRAPRMTLAVRGDVAAAQAELEKAGLRVAPGRWLRSALAVESGAAGPALARSEVHRRGRIAIQDEASQMIPLLLEVQPGECVADVCAAPGGKTMALAQAAGSVVACDISVERLRGLREQLKRVAAGNVSVVALDATRPLPLSQEFDAILVDAPCSGTGTLGRNPEIRWRLRAADLAGFHARQVAMLESALAGLKPGGRMVYATCSLEAEEDEQVIEEFLAAHPEVEFVPAKSALKQHLQNAAEEAQLVDKAGNFCALPWQHGTDGFFAAQMRKRTTAGR
jgi:16S rRNA (cytosine967-C5)-methyltransferase